MTWAAAWKASPGSSRRMHSWMNASIDGRVVGEHGAADVVEGHAEAGGHLEHGERVTEGHFERLSGGIPKLFDVLLAEIKGREGPAGNILVVEFGRVEERFFGGGGSPATSASTPRSIQSRAFSGSRARAAARYWVWFAGSRVARRAQYWSRWGPVWWLAGGRGWCPWWIDMRRRRCGAHHGYRRLSGLAVGISCRVRLEISF